MSLDSPAGREVLTPIEIKFGQLIDEAEGDPKKRSKMFRVITTPGRRDPRENIILRERLVRHYYHVLGPNAKLIAAKTGLSSQYINSKLASIRNAKMTTAELDEVKQAVAAVERDFTKDGVSGILGKLDQLATLSWVELMRRLVKEPELFENRDLVYLFRSVLEQFNAMVDRIRTADPNSTAQFLSTQDAVKAVQQNQTLLEKMETPEKLKVVEGKGE